MRTISLTLCCLTLGLFVVLASAADVAGVGKVTRLIPRADVTRAAKTLRLQQNDHVAENDRVRTASGGRTRLELDDGSLISLGSASELVVHRSTGATRDSALDLRYGRVRAWVASRSGADLFQIRTATAVAGVLGTTLFVEASRDLTRIGNLSTEPGARVRVTSANPAVTEEVVLLPGEGTSVSANRAPQPPRRWTQEEMQGSYDDTDIR